jgi:hypothetical protein
MTREPIDSALRGLTELSAALKEIAGKFNEIEALNTKAAKARDEVNWAESQLAGVKAKIRGASEAGGASVRTSVQGEGIDWSELQHRHFATHPWRSEQSIAARARTAGIGGKR